MWIPDERTRMHLDHVHAEVPSKDLEMTKMIYEEQGWKVTSSCPCEGEQDG